MELPAQVIRELPAPKLRDLSEWTEESFGSQLNKIWEIGVPEENSLSWSIVLSYLYQSSVEDLPKRFSKLIDDYNKEVGIGKETVFGQRPISCVTIEWQLNKFNPFKERCAFNFQTHEFHEIRRSFDSRIEHFGNTLKKQTGEWNDDSKLNVASEYLECGIDVFFPNDAAGQRILSYPKASHMFKTRIILFQYKNQESRSRNEIINVFHFGMTVPQMHSRKLDTLECLLWDANINYRVIKRVTNIMRNPETHGRNFLKTLIKNDCCAVLEKIYRSPYIAVRLAEADFETNPVSTPTDQLSVFTDMLLYKRNLKYFRKLYDYAASCRCMFDHSVRNASDNVLEILKQIKTVLQTDLNTFIASKDPRPIDNTVKKTVSVLKQYIIFIDFQFKTASRLKTLRDETEEQNFQFWKSVIQTVLENYLQYFDKDLPESLNEISDKFINYLRFSEYYENVDHFAYISFFDNFYQLRLYADFKAENFFTNIEWKMFVSIISQNLFSASNKDIQYDLVVNKMKCQKDYVLRYIPFFHRNLLRQKIKSFLENLKNSADIRTFRKTILESGSENDTDAFSQVTDEILLSRLDLHIEAALKVSPVRDGMKAVLVIERALQVIGESIKPSNSSTGIVSFFLKCCFSNDLQKAVVNIRNDLSHYYSSSVYGRLEMEVNVNYFSNIKVELIQMKKYFEIVHFTQLYRTEESIIRKCIVEIGDSLDAGVKRVYDKKYVERLTKRYETYSVHKNKCEQLLFDTLLDLQQNFENEDRKNVLVGHLMAARFLLDFTEIHKRQAERTKGDLLMDIETFISRSAKKELVSFKKDLSPFLNNVIRELDDYKKKDRVTISAFNIESFLNLLKKKIFSEEDQEVIRRELESAYKQAIKALENVRNVFISQDYESEEFDELLKRVLIPFDKVDDVRKCFESRNAEKALKLLRKYHFSKDKFEKDVGDMLKNDSDISDSFKILLMRVINPNSKIYVDIKLTEEILQKLKFILTKKVQFLITRLKAMKKILIGHSYFDRTFDRNIGVKYHRKVLMCQRYMRDTTVRASLDMAFFDCVNILNKKSLSEFYEKSTDLFCGINLRNVLAHRTNIPEKIGGILDENDFPSAMIDKMLKLIESLEALESMLKLFLETGILEKETFKKLIEDDDVNRNYAIQIRDIKAYEKWKDYLLLFSAMK